MSNLEKLLGKLQNKGLEGKLKKSYYHKVLSEVQRIIHAQIPEENYNSEKVASTTNIREENFKGVNYQRVVLYLLSRGCEWAVKNAHGCTMCGHLAKQTRRDALISVRDYTHQFEGEFKKIDFKKYPLLNLYNNGSFLNDNEIPPEARRKILKKINSNTNIKMLVLETRPEFVTEEKIKEIKDHIIDKHVEIAIGLELKDDFYRTICINKGFSLRQFISAASIIIRHLNLRTYVLLKPAFLTEKESIEQAIETIEYAFELGATTVSLEACTIQDYTLLNYLHERGLYRTPWLWSIIEILKKSASRGKLIIGLFQFHPSPHVVPYNCDLCSGRVMEAIHHYNRTLDVKLIEGLDCECKKRWKEILREKPVPFEKRLELIMGEINLSISQGWPQIPIITKDSLSI